MVLKKFNAIACALVLALATLFSLAFSGQAQAAGITLYWCDFSGNGNFNSAGNWDTIDNNGSCSGTPQVPVSGDSLVFDNTTPTSSIRVTNNITGLDLNSISFEGTSNTDYDLVGDAISLDNGISDIGTGTGTNTIGFTGAGITLTNAQTFTTGSDTLDISSPITGSDSLTFSGPGSGQAIYDLSSADTGLSGPIVIDGNAVVEDTSGTLNALGTGSITVNSGGVLMLQSDSDSGTLPNSLSLSGSGLSANNLNGAIVSCLGYVFGTGCQGDSNSSTLTLSGNVSLTGDTEVVNQLYYPSESSSPATQATFDFTGDFTRNGFTLSAVSNSSTIVDQPAIPDSDTGSGGSSASCSTGGSSTGSDSGTGSSSGSASGSSSGSASGTASGSASSAPCTPDTGIGFASYHSGIAILAGFLIAGALFMLVAISKRVNKSQAKK